MKKLRLIYLLLMLLVTDISVLAAAKVTNERSGEDLSHTLECKSPTDIFKSPVSGFIEIVISDDPNKEVLHLPVSQIADIMEFPFGVYIEWKAERMKNGAGYMANVVYVPKAILSPEKVIALIEACGKK